MSESKKRRLRLSAAGIERAIEIEESNFILKIGKKSLKIPRFLATFISPIIHQQLIIDSTLSIFSIEDSLVEESSIELFEELLHGHFVDIEGTKTSGLVRIASLLGESEIEGELIDIELGNESMTVSNIVTRIEKKRSHSRDIGDEIFFLIEHIDDIGLDDISRIGSDIFEVVLKDDRLKIASEDWLVDVIHDLGSNFIFLIRYVECKFLSLQGIEKYIELIDANDIDCLLWSRICDRLRCWIEVIESPRESCRVRDCDVIAYNNSPWSGIFDHLRRDCGGNVHLKRAVTVISSADYSDYPYHLADQNYGSSWYSTNHPNSWIEFDFKRNRVSPTGYVIKSNNQNNYYLVGWVIEGSNDGLDWTKLDERNTQELSSNSIIRYFSINDSSNLPFFRHIRLRQTAKNSSGNDHLVISCIELFGCLRTVCDRESGRRSQ
jgi:hypothetical protein